MHGLRLAAIALAACVCVGMPPAVRAQSLPSVNLGATSFLDGMAPAGPGLYFAEYFQHYRATRFNDDGGGRIPLPGPRLDVWASLTQFIYLADFDVFGVAKPALDVLVPAANVNLDFIGPPGPFPRATSGLGDLLIGPALQFEPIMGPDGPLFVTRVEAQMIFPTGEHSRNREINPGSGFFSFDPYWSGTAFLGKKWAASYRAHYLWNADNNHPARSLGASTAQAGQAFHVNFAIDRELLPKKLRAGLNGYYLRQTTDSTLDGVGLGRREQVLGIGPGVLYSFSQQSHLFCNVYFESEATDRPQGLSSFLRFVHRF